MVDDQVVSGEMKRFCEKLAALVTGMDGDETVGADHVTSQVGRRVIVGLGDVERDLIVSRGQETGGNHVGATVPIEAVAPGADEAFQETAVEVDTVAARGEDCVRDAIVGRFSNQLAVGHESFGEGHDYVGSSEVALCGIGVQMFELCVAKVEKFERCPAHEIIRCPGGDAANLPVHGSIPGPMEQDVAFARLIPPGSELTVVGGGRSAVLGDHRFLVNGLPVDGIG